MVSVCLIFNKGVKCDQLFLSVFFQVKRKCKIITIIYMYTLYIYLFIFIYFFCCFFCCCLFCRISDRTDSSTLLSTGGDRVLAADEATFWQPVFSRYLASEGRQSSKVPTATASLLRQVSSSIHRRHGPVPLAGPRRILLEGELVQRTVRVWTSYI